jgi:phosphotransferase system enzyme I (PtsP)
LWLNQIRAAAGRPVEALCLAPIGLCTLSTRPASVGPVTSLLQRCDLEAVRRIIHDARTRADQSVRLVVMDYLRDLS